MITQLGALILGAAILLIVEFKILSEKAAVESRLRKFVQGETCTILLIVLLVMGLAIEIKYFVTISSPAQNVPTALWMAGVPVLALVGAVIRYRRYRKRAREPEATDAPAPGGPPATFMPRSRARARGSARDRRPSPRAP